MQDDSASRRAADGSFPPTRPTFRALRKLEGQSPAIGYQVTLRLKDDRPIAAGLSERRAAAGVMIRQGRSRRLLACVVGDVHAHAIVLCPRAEAGEFAGRTATTLHRVLRLDVAFEPARIKPIAEQRDLASAFDSLLRQAESSPLSVPDFHEGTNLPDLVGLRVNGAYSRRLLREQLPQISDRSLIERLQVDWSREVDFDPSLLIEATLAATGRSSLAGRKSPVLVARRAAAAVARPYLKAPELAELFGIDVRTAFRLRAADYDEALAHAIELQMRWRALRARAAD